MKIQVSSRTSRNGYDPACFASIFAIEDQHFWFRSRNQIIAMLVKQITKSLKPGYRVLDVGCGTGNVLRFLQQACPDGWVLGMDMFAGGLKFASKRVYCPLVQGDIRALPFNKQFDIIGLFDVLEHIPDDIQALRNLHRVLANDGVLLITVPANPSLWSYFDDISRHYRRYELVELENKLINNGYKIDYITYYMASIFPLIWLGRHLKRLIDNRSADDMALDELYVMPIVNDLLALVLSQELRLISRRLRLPIGASLLAIARRSY